MRIVILGGSGFIGKEFALLLLSQGHTLIIPSRGTAYVRQGDMTFVHWDGHTAASLAEIVERSDAVVNLLGENISSGRWSRERKDRIVQSRMLAKTMYRPAWLPLPGPLLRLVLGDMATELLLGGQKAVPTLLTESGFSFRYPTLEAALHNVAASS